MTPKVEVHRQNLPDVLLQINPSQTWRCDITWRDGAVFTGYGATKLDAIDAAHDAWYERSDELHSHLT